MTSALERATSTDIAPTTSHAGPVSSRPSRGPERPPLLLVGLAIVIAAGLFAPILVVVWFSFNSTKSLSVFTGWSWRWYEMAWANESVRSATLLSFQVALVVAVVSTVIGTGLAIGLRHTGARLRIPFELLLLLTLVTPEIASAIAALLLFTGLGVTLSPATLIAAHITFSIPYVAIVVRARLDSLHSQYEEAARDLGASPGSAVRLVVLPLLWPAIVGSSLLVFMFSFDNFVTSFFTSGPTAQTLPLYIYASMRFGVTPEVNAIATIITVGTLTAGVLGRYLTSASSRRQGGAGS